MRSARPDIVFRPLSNPALMLSAQTTVRADESSRLVNEFVWTFIQNSVQMVRGAKVEQLRLPMGV